MFYGYKKYITMITIIIAQANFTTAEFLENMLKRHYLEENVEIHTTTNPTETKITKVLSRKEPYIFITGYKLDLISGEEAVQFCKEQNPQMRSILWTTYDLANTTLFDASITNTINLSSNNQDINTVIEKINTFWRELKK